jgi:4-hydroxy-tetrahydrodipicolinate synthase
MSETADLNWAEVHHRLVPLMLGNFIESNPGPVKFAMASMGLCEEVYRLPMVSPRPASQEKIRALLKELGISAEVHH